MNIAEHWLPVVGYEGYYEVSDRGGVRSVPRVQIFADGRTFHFKGRKLTPAAGPRGHLSLVLCRDGGRRTKAVHRLVAEAFIPNTEGLPSVLHWDDVKTNNTSTNLRWGTEGHNRADAVRNGRNHNANKLRCKRGHKFDLENTYHPPAGGRACRKCARARLRAFKEKQRAAKKIGASS